MTAKIADPPRHGRPFVDLIDQLARSRRMLATAESLTGGLLASCVASTPGAGDVFLGGIVSYAREVKRNLLEVPPGPVVSAPAAAAMALGAARLLGADVAVSLTGVAGPEGQDGERPGTVFIAVTVGGDVVTCRRFCFAGDPDEVRDAATIKAAELVIGALR